MCFVLPLLVIAPSAIPNWQIASIFTLRHFNELTSLPRTWASSYEHNENFMKKQGMSRASQVKQSSPANRIGSHHLNKSLFLAARPVVLYCGVLSRMVTCFDGLRSIFHNIFTLQLSCMASPVHQSSYLRMESLY